MREAREDAFARSSAREWCCSAVREQPWQVSLRSSLTSSSLGIEQAIWGAPGPAVRLGAPSCDDRLIDALFDINPNVTIVVARIRISAEAFAIALESLAIKQRTNADMFAWRTIRHSESVGIIPSRYIKMHTRSENPRTDVGRQRHADREISVRTRAGFHYNARMTMYKSDKAMTNKVERATIV
jgi:hypothetical protein